MRCCLKFKRANVLAAALSDDTGPVSTDGNVYRYELVQPAPNKDVDISGFAIGMALINVVDPVAAHGSFMRGISFKSKSYAINKCLDREGIKLLGPDKEKAPLYYYLDYEVDLSEVRGERICK